MEVAYQHNHVLMWLKWTSPVICNYQQGNHPEGGGSKVLWNVGILLHCYTVPKPRKPQLEHLDSCLEHT